MYYTYTWFTKEADEHNEIEKNNLTLSLLISITILGMTIFIRPSVDRMLSSLVPYDLAEQWASDSPKHKNQLKMRFNTK